MASRAERLARANRVAEAALDKKAADLVALDVSELTSYADTFVIATATSVLTLLLTTVFGPLQKFLKTTSLDVRQWLICLAVALSIVVVSEIRKAVRRRTAPGQQTES